MRSSALLFICCLALTVPVPTAAQTHARSMPPMAGGFAAAAVFHDGELFVGRPGEVGLFPLPANRTGAVHVYSWSDGAWVETGTVEPADNELSTGFGEALAVDDGVLVVGAPRSDGTGAAYVFDRDGDGWSEVAKLQRTDGVEGEGFGTSVAIEGDVILVGSPTFDDQGRATAFALADGSWSQSGELSPSQPAPGGHFGQAVALADGWAAVSAPGEMIGLLPGLPQPRIQPGTISVYSVPEGGADWDAAATLQSNQPGPGGLGWALAFSDGDILGSAPFANQFSGGAFRFSHDEATGEWSQAEVIAAASAPPQSLIGISMAVAGDEVVLGAPILGGGPGGAVIFRRGESGAFAEVQLIQGADPFGFMGLAVAVQPGHVLVGAPGEAFFEGTGHVFAAAGDEYTAAGTLIDTSSGMEAVTGGEVACETGVAAAFDCEEVDLVSFVPVQDLGGERGVIVNDLWGWTDPETGREYAVVGRNNGTSFVDVTDPTNPVFLGSLPLTEGATVNMWRDVKVARDHAFVVADNAGAHGMQIFDLRQLRDVEGAPVVFEETAIYDGIHSAHNVVVNDEVGFAYIVGASGGGTTCGGGLHMVDINDPSNPTFAGCFSDSNTGHASTGYSHDAQCFVYHGPDEEHQGKDICFGANENAVSVADVSDKSNPVALAAVAYPNSVYLHQGWVSDDHRWFYMNDELDEIAGAADRTRTLVWDIEDLDDPILVTEHMGTNQASDHNLYVQGDFMYQSNYLSGLRVLDISDPANPVEVGYFDTVPQGEDVPGFAGSWSNYPFFESGIILVSSMREGLFILKKRETTPIT